MTNNENIIRIFHALCLDNTTRQYTSKSYLALWSSAKDLAKELDSNND